MKILVRNLATATTEEKLKSLFVEYGTVQSCSLVLDKATGKSKGFGFVEMPKVGEAKAAMKTLNGYKLAGNFIRVKKAEPKTEAVEDTTAAEQNTVPTAATAEKTQKDESNKTNYYGKIKKSDD
ncbi:MAG: RNA recognition motif-containing protein [Psychromonas sp.]|jgi:RNA recognition motif-containing protein|uniref:RNA recognition motif domain-containing protein n=1 Tax=Psychromonas sp. TaxID=1884585 RepID=UPI0039E62FC2